MKYAILILLLLSAPACASGQWGLLVVHHDGAVVITHGLSRHDCERSRARVLGIPFTDAEKKAAADAKAEQEKREAENHTRFYPKCPGTSTDMASDKTWKDWHAAHPDAQGCTQDGGGLHEWSGAMGFPGTIIGPTGQVFSINGMPQGSEITHAECFR